MFIAVDEKGYLIVPQKETSEIEISPEKILLNFFLKHIINPENLGYNDINVYTNIIFKELTPQAMAHSSESFQHISVGKENKLFDSETSEMLTDNIEQVISKGKALQKDFFDSYIENKETLPITTQSDGVHYKKIALNGLLLASGIFKTLNNNYKSYSGHGNLFNEINIRHSRSLPEEHAAPAEKLGVLTAKKLEESIVPKLMPFYNLLTKLEKEQEQEHYIRGYHELLTFSQTGIWNRNGRGAARDYIVELIKDHYYRFEIGSDNRKSIFFRDFIKDNREHEFNIYKTIARDIIVHPLPFHLDYAPPKKGELIITQPENHYMQTVRHKFSLSTPLLFDDLYGKESIYLTLELNNLRSNRKSNKRNFEHIFKCAQLVIRHLSKDGGDKILCSTNGVKHHRLILSEIVAQCEHYQRHFNNNVVNYISKKIIRNSDFSPHLKSVISSSDRHYFNSWLMKLAVEKQLSWAETHYKAQNHIENHIQDCELLGLMDVNKMLRDAITGFVHQISEITESSWMSSEEQHTKQIQALEIFKTKISSMNGGQAFVYGFNKVIQEGLGGLIELSFDIDDTRHHRTSSSLSPASRSGLHLLGTIWNIVMSAAPGFNALAGTSSILNHAVVEKSTDVCNYMQDVIRIGMEAIPAAESKFTQRSSNAKYTGLRFSEEKINKNIINEPQQRGSSYRVIESIENTDFIYQKSTRKILELASMEGNELYSATGFNNENYGYYKRSGDGFYRKQHSYQPLSNEMPNKIKYNNRELELTKESNSNIYSGTFTDNGKNSLVKFYKDSDGNFYQADGLKGGGLIRHTDKPYSELKEGDIGYDEELLDITDDSPELEETLPAISEDLYPSEEENVQNIYRKFRSGDHDAGMTEVTLCRGTIASQAENIVSYSTAGGGEIANPNVSPVSEDTAKLQIKSGRIEPEYTTDISVADRFSRGHYLVIVKAKVKYLTRGSISESGWIIPQNAPVEPVGLIDRTFGQSENIQQANASK
ncbi:putative T3SS effector protein EspN2-2 [Escherichia coli DEC2E]|nr:putative T3SS effector protein EspN2-2 [Escherichia coli DEC2E]